jgi:hypothetical protein
MNDGSDAMHGFNLSIEGGSPVRMMNEKLEQILLPEVRTITYLYTNDDCFRRSYARHESRRDALCGGCSLLLNCKQAFGSAELPPLHLSKGLLSCHDGRGG